MPELDRHDDVFVLDIGDTENRFHPDWLASVSDLLDEVEKAEGPRALVTAATGKFFSNGLPFTVGMSALIQARLTPQTAHQAMTTGRRYGGHDALAAAIVDQIADEHGVRQAAAEIVQPQAAKAGPTLGTIKTRMYAPVLDALRQKDY